MVAPPNSQLRLERSRYSMFGPTMGDHDDLPLPPRMADTILRQQGDRDTLLGADHQSLLASLPMVGDHFGHFRIEKYLGQGSSGCVFRAFDCELHRHFALKFVCNDPAENLVRTKIGFRRMMRVEHPNLARADQIHRSGHQIALSMEEIHGDTFANSLRKMRELSIDDACNQLLHLMRDYAAALAAMHDHGFVHRDIKPQNLMIDENGRGRIIDYGLVGTFDAEINPSGIRNYLVGTHGYFAPEALTKQCYLPAGDIYCLGRVILEALRKISASTLRALDCEETDDDTDIVQARLSDIQDTVPRVLYDACQEMLQPSPGDRPTASQVMRHGLNAPAKAAWPNEKPMWGRDKEYQRMCDWIRKIYTGGTGRLHLYGPLGIGTTRLIDEVEKFLQSKPFGQFFRASCRAREEHPFHAFDQIVDEIANRYMKNDLQRSRLDPVSAGILHEVFPALRGVVDVNMKLPVAGMKTVRLDALEAASRLSVELRKNGPLILIIDDAHWADPDSVAVLDRLRDAPGESLGIITVSRTRDEDRYQRKADVYVELKPLTMEQSQMILAGSASHWSSEIDAPLLRDLAQLVEGNPFRLSELAQEFRPGGLLSKREQCNQLAESISKGAALHWLCDRRVERLSPEAKLILPLIVAAGRPVSLEQLDALSGLGEHVDAPVSELVKQRLVTDEARGSECIGVSHDRISDGLIAVLQPSEIRRAHRAWADWLLQQNPIQVVAARVAGHLFDADEPTRAVSSAIMAAKHAERIYAHRDGGRWYARVLPYVSGAERVQCLRDAARCFETADLPVEAAHHYQELAKFVDSEERTECLVSAIAILIRSGRFNLVRHQLGELSRELKLPRPKRWAFASVSILYRVGRLRFQQWRQRRSMVKAAHSKQSFPVKLISSREKQRLAFCLCLTRPLSLFNNLYASELNLFAARLTERSGDVQAQLYCWIGSAVFGCYDKGASRIKGESLLQDLRPQIVALADHNTLGDYWAASAFSHMFACRWHLVCERVEQSISYYEKLERSHGFEISHTQMACIWAQWHLGRWDMMAKLHDGLLSESIHRNDLYQRLQASLGLIATVLLARNKPEEVTLARQHCDKILSKKDGVQWFDHQGWISSMLHSVYCCDWDGASKLLREYRKLSARSPVRKLQVLRVTYWYFAALVSLHRMRLERSKHYAREAKQAIDRLRGEQLEYTAIVANLFDGLYHEMRSKPEIASLLLQDARDKAADLQLRPIQCAAIDALKRIETGRTGETLRERMREQGIVRPEQFEWLYTVRIDNQ